MLENRSAPLGPIVPRLIYDDVDRAIEWLRGAFGFTERLRTSTEPDGTIHHAQLGVGEGGLILTGQPGGKLNPSPKSVAGGPFPQALLVRVEDIDAHFERASKYGARIRNPLKTHEYGERQYTAEDPEGYLWTFSQSVADVDPALWAAKVGDIKGRLAGLARPRVCYLEIPAIEVTVSAAFYEKVFGWNIRRRDSQRPSFDDATGNVSGAFVTGRPASREPGLLVYIWVDNIEATLAAATQMGGEVVEAARPDHPGSTSFIATFLDPAGNLMGLYQET
jgi:uncharacterized protein